MCVGSGSYVRARARLCECVCVEGGAGGYLCVQVCFVGQCGHRRDAGRSDDQSREEGWSIGGQEGGLQAGFPQRHERGSAYCECILRSDVVARCVGVEPEPEILPLARVSILLKERPQ